MALALAHRAHGDPTPANEAEYASLSASARLGITFKSATASASLPVAALPGTVSMPQYIVREPRVPSGPEDILTAKGTLALAKGRYLSPFYRIALGPLAQLAAYYIDPLSLLMGWHPNDAEALVLYRQDKRLEKLKEIDSLIGLELMDNPKAFGEFQVNKFDASTRSR